MQSQAEKLPGSTALAIFCGQEESQREFNGDLRSILEVTATTGKYWHDWSQLKHLFRYRLAQVLQEFNGSNMSVDTSAPNLIGNESFEDLLGRLLQGLDSFVDGAPFTCQRLCELLLNPRETYVNLDKLALAFEKLLLITTTEPASADPYPSVLLPSAKHQEPLRKELVIDEVKPVVVTINGSHETNGRHEEAQTADKEMVDVQDLVDQGPVAQAEQPVVFGAVPSDTSQRTGSEEASNGHIGESGEEVQKDISLSDDDRPATLIE